MLIYVIRHGETSWNVLRKLQGHQGADLDEKGVRLAEITGEALKVVPFDICYTSPLIRARHTAEILLKGREIPIILEPRIMEIGFGEWEGLCCAPGRMEMPEEEFQKFYRDPFHFGAPPGGENSTPSPERRTGRPPWPCHPPGSGSASGWRGAGGHSRRRSGQSCGRLGRC